MNKFRRTLGASTLRHDKVVNLAGQDIGRIEELMVDVTTGRVAYAVLSFGGFMGIGNKLFALPWSALTVDEAKKRFVVNVTRESLEKMPGFDKEHWPDLNDLEYATGVYRQWAPRPTGPERAFAHGLRHGGAAPRSGARSATSAMPSWRAQCAQQKYWPRASMPCPMIGTLQ